MKKILLLITVLIKLVYCNHVFANPFSLSPYQLAQNEIELRTNVDWQTGCALPELSKSVNGGEATLNVFLNGDGTTKKIEIEKSTGTPEENLVLINTFKNCDFIERSPTTPYPLYFYKSFEIKWPFDGKNSLIGLQRCMRTFKYPTMARARHIEGNVIWKVRPTADNKFEKELVVAPKDKILISHSQSQLDKCLKNPDIVKSIRDNFKDGKWDEFRVDYKLTKR